MINLIFDMDGTIIDSNNAIVCTVNELRATLDLAPLKRDEIIKLMNNPSVDFKAIVYENRLKIDTEPYFKKHYEKSVILYDGVKWLLDWAKDEGHFIAMATNASSKTTNHILSKLGVLAYFDLILCAGDGYEPKPSPNMLELISQKAAFKDSLFIGDSDKDKQSAINANMAYLIVKWYEEAKINSAKSLQFAINQYIKEKDGLF